MSLFSTAPKRWPARWLRPILLLSLCATSFFVHLDAQDVGLMEARNFVAAREIHAGGSWLLPTMNGQLRLAKPPLPTWLVTLVMEATGTTTNLGLLRLPSALGATLLVFGFWMLARRLVPDGRTAWLAAVVLASSLLMLTVGRDGNGWDVYCYSFMVWALAALVRGWQSTGQGYGWFAAAGALIGLSILSKGPVAPYGLLLPFVISYAWRGDRAQLRNHRGGAILALVVALVVGGAWPAYVAAQHLSDVVGVARTESTAWLGRHVKSLLFYLPFPIWMGLWVIVTLSALVWPYARPRLQPYIPYLLVLTWALLTVGLLSLVPEKKERYLLPVLPPLALLVAGMLQHWLEQSTSIDKRLQQIWAGLLVLVGIAIPVGLAFVRLPDYRPGDNMFLVSTVAFVAVAVVAAVGVKRPSVQRPLACSLAATVLFTVLLMPLYPRWEQHKDDLGLRPQALVMRQHPEMRQWPVYSWGSEMHIKWVWAAARTVPVWQPADTQPLQHLPLVLYSSEPLTLRMLPASWRQRVRLTLIDSFTLSHKLSEGYWYVSHVQPR